jgi:hypothetical protein
MIVKILKVASKRNKTGNFTEVVLQVDTYNQEEQALFLGRGSWGVSAESPWVQYALEIGRAVDFVISGIEFAGTIQRAKLQRPDIAGACKTTLVIQKDICEADMHLSAMVRARNEEGEMLSVFCSIVGFQIELEGGE